MGGFSKFYPFYLSQHANRTCRRLHFVGTTLGLLAALHALSTLNFWWLAAGLVAGYALVFTHPIYGFMGDWVMWKDMLTGRIRF